MLLCRRERLSIIIEGNHPDMRDGSSFLYCKLSDSQKGALNSNKIGGEAEFTVDIMTVMAY